MVTEQEKMRALARLAGLEFSQFCITDGIEISDKVVGGMYGTDVLADYDGFRVILSCDDLRLYTGFDFENMALFTCIWDTREEKTTKMGVDGIWILDPLDDVFYESLQLS